MPNKCAQAEISQVPPYGLILAMALEFIASVIASCGNPKKEKREKKSISGRLGRQENKT